MDTTTTSDTTSAAPTGFTVEQFADTVFADLLGAQNVSALYLGDRLGWYRTLAAEGPMTADELAHRTGTVPRYAREWLEHQSVAGYITAQVWHDPVRFELPQAHAEVLVNQDSLSYMASLSRFLAATGAALPSLVEAYRNGGGVSWQQLGTDAREAQAYANRPMFLGQLTQDFLPQIPDLHQRLQSGGQVADIGCGEGWSAIALALGYPEITVDGFDVDAASIAAATRNAAAHGVGDRVHFRIADLRDAELTGRYDAVLAFECVHDLSDPVAFLSTARRIAVPGGPVVIMDERTAESFAADAGPVEQLLYGFSILCCLPDGMSDPGSAATGTVMRHSTLESYARSAGFDGATIVDIDHDMFRFYRLQ
jgi:2-polyprenyl-3-methyl-5-hydroxy-6-metoxy-1,4-benzoquinol methylase